MEDDLDVNVTVGKPMTFTLTAQGDADDDPADVVIQNVTSLPVDAAFKRSQQWYTTFSWTPTNSHPVALRYVSTEEHTPCRPQVCLGPQCCVKQLQSLGGRCLRHRVTYPFTYVRNAYKYDSTKY